jgi:HK97 family phage major capsid protein
LNDEEVPIMDLQTLTAKQDKLLLDAKALYAKAEKAGGFGDDDGKRYDELLKEAEGTGKSIAALKARQSDQELQHEFGTFEKHPDFAPAVQRAVGLSARKSLGQEFAESAAGKWLAETKGVRPSAWRSPVVELKATLTEDPASGGALVVPQFRPGVVPTPLAPPTVASLFAQGAATSNAVTYMLEKTYVNAAAPVLEGAAKPESTLTFEAKTQPLVKVAHWLPVSDEMLDDVAQITSYLDARLRLGVALEVDDQILNAATTGLLVRADLTPPVAATAGKGLEAITQAIADVEIASQLVVDAIVMHPADWSMLAATTNAQGDYLGPSPFETPAEKRLWGRRVATTPAMPQGTAIVGAFATGGGQLFVHGAIKVEASNSHADYWIKNLVAVRAEVRFALCLYRPVGFAKVTGIAAAA